MSRARLGRYELVRVLGKGAMGLVYEGRDPNLDRRVAIKTIKVENLTNEEAAEYEVRFRTEARSAARLQHPNIVSVYDSDRDGEIAYLVMEYVEGQDLKHHLDRGQQYSLQEAAAIMNDLLGALDYAHRQNIVHRDIKPANLLIEAGGRTKLTDFGVARIQDSGEATRTKGTMVGTLKYMSPEQVQGLPSDARSDLFSAGVLLYQLLTAIRPFDGSSDFEVIQKIVTQPAQPPSRINPQLPPAIDEVISRTLAKSRDARYQTAQEFNAALQTAAATATDPTIKPLLNSARAVESSTWTSTVLPGESLVSTNTGNGTGVPTSSVAQEVELIYWKEIKDSEDADDFRSYLARFPAGIYADLARRRLKRLSGGTGNGSLPGMATADIQPPPGAGTASEDLPTVMIVPPPATEPSPPQAPAFDQPKEAAADSAPTRPAPPGGPGATTPGMKSASAPTASRSSAKVLIGAGLAVAAASVLAYLAWSGAAGSAAEPPLAAISGPAIEAAMPASDAARVPVPTAKTTPAVPHRAAAEKRPPTAKTGAGSASGAEASAAGRSKPKLEGAATKADAQAAVAPPSVAPTPAAPQALCEGRSFFGRLSCMKEECDKPANAQHPECLKWHEMEERNRESR